MSRKVLLLTATVTPKAGQSNLLIQNPERRLEEYCRALDFYVQFIGSSISGIIFAENSGFDLSILSSRYQVDGIEWISTGCFDYPAEYHRGYGEFLIIDYVITNSVLLEKVKNIDSDCLIIKASGRYKILNFPSFVHFIPNGYDIIAQTKVDWVELSVIVFSLRGWHEFLSSASKRFATPMVPEVILASALADISHDLRVRRWFFLLPYLVGKRGSDGSSYQGNFGFIRYCFRLARYHLGRILNKQ